MDEKTYRNSKFLHLFERKGANTAYCIFHSLTQRKVYGGEVLKSLYEIFRQSLSPEEARRRLSGKYPDDRIIPIINDLKDKGLIVLDSDTDLHTYLKFFNAGLDLYTIRHTYFIPMSDCNFRCSYCFIEDESRGYPTGRMTIRTARKSLEVFAKLTEHAEKITLVFYGGEPLLNADVVYESMRFVRELEKKGIFKRPVEMSILTNGVLVNKNTVQAVLETNTKVSISIDGPKYIHDAARKDIFKKGTFDQVLKKFRMLQEAGINPGVSCTLSRYNIDHIEEVVEFIAKELKPPGMGFNILLPTICSGNPLDVCHEYAAKQIIVAFKRLREYGIYEDRVMRRVTPFKDRFFHYKDCMGVGGQIVITPQGTIGPCQAFLGLDKYFPLNVDALHANLSELDSDEIYKDPLFKEWRHRFPLNMKDCADCVAIAVCGGGCPYASQVNHGSIWKIDERICYQSKAILEWMIWDTYDHMTETEANL